MKDFLFFLFLTLLLFACSKSVARKTKISSEQYKVYKIDSINKYYLIYAKRNDTLYKIVSEKDSNYLCRNIKLNKMYAFKLRSMINNLPKINNVSLYVYTINCYSFDEETSICLEKDSIRNLYFPENIKGLCFIK